MQHWRREEEERSVVKAFPAVKDIFSSYVRVKSVRACACTLCLKMTIVPLFFLVVNCKYLRFGPKYKTRVSLSFFLSFDDPSVLKKLLLFLALVLLLFLLPRQIERILRPLVLGTLFRASSLRSRGVRNTERKRCVASR